MTRNLVIRLALISLICVVDAMGAPQDMPQPKRRVDPAYPEIFKRAGIEADVDIKVLVNESGLVDRSEVVSASNPDFVPAAMEAAAQWKFLPAKKDGRAIKAEVTIPFRFRLPKNVPGGRPQGFDFLKKLENFLHGDPAIDLLPDADPEVYIVMGTTYENLRSVLGDKTKRMTLTGKFTKVLRMTATTNDAETSAVAVFTMGSNAGHDERYHTIVMMKNNNNEWKIKAWHTSPK